MRFPFKFQRAKGSTSHPTLGADATPSGPPPANQDNVFYARGSNTNGWPVHRIAVGYSFVPLTTGAAPTLNARMYIFEDATQVWYQVGAQVAMAPNTVSFFEAVPLGDMPADGRFLDSMPSAISQWLQVDDPGAGAPNGTYTFVMGPVLTTES